MQDANNNAALSHEEAIKKFVEDIVDEASKKVPAMSSETARQYLIEDLVQRLLDLIDRALIEALPDDKLNAFNALLDREDSTPDEVQRFVADAGVDVTKVTSLTMLQFRDQYLRGLGE